MVVSHIEDTYLDACKQPNVLVNPRKRGTKNSCKKQLSDAFKGLGCEEAPNLELVVNVVNINYDTMPKLMKENEDIAGYAIFVGKVRKHLEEGKQLTEAIRETALECQKEGILKDFLNKFMDEVDTMFSLIYDEATAIKVAREEGLEEGLEKGREEGLEKGREEGLEKGREEGREEGREKGREEGFEEGLDLSAEIIEEIFKQTPAKEIAKKYKTTIQKVNQLKSIIMRESA